MLLSTIGYASSSDGIHFKNRRQFIKPEYDWEKFGCEDPRVTKMNGKCYIFYTALSTFPFCAPCIRVGLAVTRDFKKVLEKHPITTFNSKAMSLFPEKVGGRYTAVLSVNTDIPPTEIAVVYFDREEQMWEPSYWDGWYSLLNDHIIPLQRSPKDHIEAGAPPIKTKYGWRSSIHTFKIIFRHRQSSVSRRHCSTSIIHKESLRGLINRYSYRRKNMRSTGKYQILYFLPERW